MAKRSVYDAPIAGCADPTMTVLGLLEHMKEVKQRDQRFYLEAELRERVVLGEYGGGEVDAQLLEQAVVVDALREPMRENVILPAIQTLVARTDQGRIDAKAWPHTPTPARVAAAEGANLFLDSERARERRDQKVHDALFWALIHGECFLYVTWDESYGPIEAIEPVLNPEDGQEVIDQATGQPSYKLAREFGACRVEVVSTFNLWTSGEDDPEFTRWQVRRRIVDKWTAMAHLKRAGIVRKCEDTAVPVRGERTRMGVEVFEMWVKPGDMIEKGMFALVVDGCVCLPPKTDKAGKPVPNQWAKTPSPFPYKHKKLPGVLLSCMRVEDTPHGHTVVKGGIFQQRLVDVSLRSILRRADVSGDARFVGASEVVESIDSNREGRIAYTGTRDVRQVATWVVGPEVDQTAVTVYQMAKSSLHDVIGVSNETVTGGDPTSTSSGEQLKTASALDSQKNVPLRRRAEGAFEQVDQMKIELFRERASKPRLANTVGGVVRARYLSGADLEGVDVAIESASGAAESHLGRARAAEESAAAGFLNPMDAGEMRQTGATETTLMGEARQRVHAQGAAALAGMAQQPLPDVQPALAARELRLMMDGAPVGRTAVLMRLIAEYENAARMAAPVQAAGAAQAQPGKPKVTNTAENAAKNAIPQGVQ